MNHLFKQKLNLYFEKKIDQDTVNKVARLKGYKNLTEYVHTLLVNDVRTYLEAKHAHDEPSADLGDSSK